jgi:erythromycin esterase-like protein
MPKVYTENDKIKVIAKYAHTLQESGENYQSVLDLVGNASLVLLGECTHGTHDFYLTRAEISKRLIIEKGFKAIAIEGDWPDAHCIHRFVSGQAQDQAAIDALRGFTRFPSWMWANTDLLDFVGWLRSYNENLPEATRPVGFYGLDIYSLFRSVQALVSYLEQVDRAAAERAKCRFACFDRFGTDTQKYAWPESFL